MTPMRCGLMHSGTAFIVVKGAWRTVQPIDKLPGFVRLYRGLRDRNGGKYAHVYAQPTEALEALAAKAGLRVADTPGPDQKKGRKP